MEEILERVATATNPRFNALIDTGALITGYSNFEVAKQLLDRGLTWCDGVVYLDDNDTQQVLVRATGRVVSADQCGVSLEKRFAFYDQIHTTGMDIKHVVNATAVITLGKDMVFRDYVQGAYRMRGIGVGQKIHVFIIPEVSQLMQRELKDAVIQSAAGSTDHVLEDVVAWLVINSLRSEQTQWTMLCVQNIGNLYRKNAFKCLLANTEHFVDGSCFAKESAAAQLPSKVISLLEEDKDTVKSNIASTATNVSQILSLSIEDEEEAFEESEVDTIDETTFVASLNKDGSLRLFDETIDFSLEASVPDPLPFEQKLRSMLDENEAFIRPEQHAIGHRYD